jgi:ATP-binding cassette, subfamily C, bacterial LapB
MSTSTITPLDVKWLAKRCSALLDMALPVSPKQIEAVQRDLERRVEEGLEIDLRSVVGQMAEMLRLPDLEWVEQPSAHALPMIALLPVIGCHILYGRTAEGAWLLEGVDGSRRIAALPAGSEFAALHRHEAEEKRGQGFLGILKETFGAKKGVLVKAGIATVLGNLFALITSFYSLQVYDRVIPTQGVSTLIVLTVGMVMIMGIDMAVRMARGLVMENYVKGVDHEMSHKIFHRLLGVRMDQFPPSVGSLASQIRSYESIRAFVSSATLYVIIDAPFGLLFLLIMVAIAGPLVGLVALVFFFLASVTGFAFRRRIEQHIRDSAGFTNRKLGLLVDAVDGAETIKASGAAWQMLGNWDRLSRRVVEDDAQVRHYSELSLYLSSFMQQLSYVLLVATGAWLACTTSSLTTGGIVACSILSGRVLAPIGMLPGLIVQWGNARVAYDQIERFFALETDNHGVSRPLNPETIRGSYHVSGLRFAYQGQNRGVAVDQLAIAAGEKVGVLGIVGSGKSTLLKLLAGLYKPRQGQILLDGLDLHQVSRHLLASRIGYLQQQVRLFAGSLRDNLLLGVSGADDDRILQVCEATGLNALIAGHPSGLDLQIAEGGAGVSGGQKQLIALTRLLLASPGIWLLDEPTASMDDGHEQRVIAALGRAIAPGDTLVLVTHKPALLSLVNRLVILTPNGIIMDGPRDEVLRRLQERNQGPSKTAVQGGNA